jgi:hypothetical protein
MSLRSGGEHRGPASPREHGAYAAARRARQIGEFWRPASSPPQEAGRGVGRSHFLLSCLGILLLTDTPGYSVQTLGSTSVTGHEPDLLSHRVSAVVLVRQRTFSGWQA